MSLFLIATLHTFSYLGLFLLLVGAAIVIPVPEEITLLTAGFFIAKGFLGWPGALVVAIAALLIGDAVLFWFARMGSTYAKKLRERVHKIGLEKTWLFSPKYPLRPVFLLRFITGFRFIAPIYAGFEQASWQWFLLIDLLSIVLYVPAMFAFGYEFHTSIVAFIAGFELFRHAAFAAVLAVAGVGLLPHVYTKAKNFRKKK